MNKLYAMFLLAVVTFSTGVVQADPAIPATTTTTTTTTTAPATSTDTTAATTDATTGIDPTLTFFTALSKCTPGDYQEKNLMADSVGGPWLKHQIIGLDPQGGCQATLATPDGRFLTCDFAADDLSEVVDQHFLDGIMASNLGSPTKDSVNSDLEWSNLKSSSCSF